MNLAANGMTVLALLGAAFPIYHLYENRAEPGALYLLALCVALAVYPFNLILLQGEAAVLFRFSVVFLVPPLYFLALFAYLRALPRNSESLRFAVFGYMVFACVIPWLSGDLFIDFAESQPRADVREYVYQHGPVAWALKTCSYAFLLVGCAAVIHRVNSSRSSRVHLISLAIFPLCTGALDLLAVLAGFSTYQGVTMLQFSATLSLFALSYALIQHRMLVRVPVSRNTLMSHMREGICVISEQGEIADCNEALASMIGVSAESLSGRTASHVLPESILAQIDAHHRQELVRDVEVQLDSGNRFLSVTVSRLEDSPTLVLSVTDITERKRLLADVVASAGALRDVNVRLEAMSLTDPLTGLGNRRKLQNALSAALQADNHPALGLIMVDIDHFKAINDTHGHAAGDQVLIALAGAIRETSRDSDTVVRWGGEEFVVVVANTDGRRLQIAAERMRLHIRQLSIELSGGVRLRVTASIGATMARPGQSPESVLRDVDRLMYEAKQGGRDCVKVSRRIAA